MIDNHWTPDRDAQLAKLWTTTPLLTASQIAERLGVTKNAVLGRRRRMNLPERGSPITSTGERPKPAKRIRVSPFWQANDSRLRELHAEGMSWGAIGQALGCSLFAARRRAINLGLEPKLPSKIRLAPRRDYIDGAVRFKYRPAALPRDLKLSATAKCQWIDGDPKVDASKCGHASIEGKSWCPSHFQRCFIKTLSPKELRDVAEAA